MKIARVEAVPIRLPFTREDPPFMAFGRELDAMELLIVEVETDTGIIGYGESPWGFWRPLKLILDDFIAPIVVGREVTDVPAFMAQLQRITYVLGRYGMTLFALSAIDIALWDIAGKVAGKPIYELLGGQRRPVPAYLTLWGNTRARRGWEWESADPDRLAADVRGAVDAGYRHVKLHATAESDMQIFRDAVGPDIGMLIDASSRWTLEQARERIEVLRPYDPFWIEEPLFPPEDFASLAALSQEFDIPIAAGENASTEYEFAAMFAAGAVTYAQPNTIRMGGITELVKVVDMARERGIRVSPHAIYYGPAYLATMQVMAAQDEPPLMEKPGIPFEVSLYGSVTTPKDGVLIPPDGPGLGIEPDPDVLREARIATTDD